LFIPNAFSPNGDRVNDYWEILGLQNYPGHKLEVFNRLGIKLYESYDYKNDWYGTYNGEKLPDGTYFYQLYLSEGVIEKGYIFIKR
jgi:gliding motility-associated-like protein